MELNFFVGFVVSIFLTLVVPAALVIWLGYGVSRLAQRLAARLHSQEYPTSQILEATFHEQPEQWPPAPTIEPLVF